jgi:hypothetical protein
MICDLRQFSFMCAWIICSQLFKGVMQMTGTVLILGSNGKIGRNAAQAFTAAMTAAAMGADLIVNGLNPPNYHNWAVLVPQITAQLITAAKASGATVIIPGNVYSFAPLPGEWSEATPHRPVTRKGKIRLAMEQAFRASGVRTIILRAGNFIDPDAQDDVMRLIYLRNIAKGQVTLCGGADVMQAYAYLPDWARAAVMLADKRAELAVYEDIPFPGHAFTATQLKAALERGLGRPLRFVGFPWWVMRVAAPFWELARELQEMRYIWNLPHSLSGTKFRALLPGFQPTDMTTVMLASLPKADLAKGAAAPA